MEVEVQDWDVRHGSSVRRAVLAKDRVQGMIRVIDVRLGQIRGCSEPCGVGVLSES